VPDGFLARGVDHRRCKLHSCSWRKLLDIENNALEQIPTSGELSNEINGKLNQREIAELLESLSQLFHEIFQMKLGTGAS
jgi:hypothetical protein